MPESIQIPSARAVISVAASVAATAMLIRSLAKDFIPYEVRNYILTKVRHFFTTCTNDIIVVIDEFDGLSKNQLFKAAEIYLGSVISPSTKRFRATLPNREKKISLSMEGNQELIDEFCGFQLKWRMVCKQIQPRYVSEPGYNNYTMRSELRYYELSFHKKHRNKVVDEYLPYVLESAKTAVLEKRTLKLYSNDSNRMMGSRGGNAWQSVNLDHPATFDTLAMDGDIKEMVINDLKNFMKRKELYRKAGKAWKRGYLLFGPPGTGKSSLIAAMANYLHFDIYDLEFTDIRSNTELRRFMVSTTNRSILVVEDIDCSIELARKRPNSSSASMHPRQYNQGDRVTLSGLLNFIDGLWSSCGDERIIVFTTNHKEKLDPALLRPGRMDVHIHMSYCTPYGFKLLASNYLGITEHPLFLEVEQRMKNTKVTPAEVGEQLLAYGEPETALKGLIEFLEEKKKIVETKAHKRTEEVSKAEEVFPSSEKNGGSKVEKAVISHEEINKLLKQEPRSEVQSQQKQDGTDVIPRALMQLLQDKKDSGGMECRERESGSSARKILPDSEKMGGTNSGNTSLEGK